MQELRFIDTHGHVNHEKLIDRIDEITKDMQCVICPSYSIETCHSTLEVCEKYKNVYGALAIHPSDVSTWGKEIENFIIKNSTNKKVVALGEYGLDYHYQKDDKNLQQEVMLAQLEIAKQQKLPSIFHVRDAFDDFISIMSNNLNNFQGGVVHCFDSDVSVAKTVLDLGLMISFTGLITHKKKEELREVVKYVPLDRMMFETDCPYLAPEPFRGSVCTPIMVEKVYEKVCEIKNINIEELVEVAKNNAENFFKKLVI